jgi:hypothetical protein
MIITDADALTESDARPYASQAGYSAVAPFATATCQSGCPEGINAKCSKNYPSRGRLWLCLASRASPPAECGTSGAGRLGRLHLLETIKKLRAKLRGHEDRVAQEHARPAAIGNEIITVFVRLVQYPRPYLRHQEGPLALSCYRRCIDRTWPCSLPWRAARLRG